MVWEWSSKEHCWYHVKEHGSRVESNTAGRLDMMQPVILTDQAGAGVKEGLEGGNREKGGSLEAKGIRQVRNAGQRRWRSGGTVY